jgi:hypothetical protein
LRSTAWMREISKQTRHSEIGLAELCKTLSLTPAPLPSCIPNATNNKSKSTVGSYCAGGPVNGAGNIATKCPAGSTTVSTGSVTISQCIVPPGSYFDGKNVVSCPGEFVMHTIMTTQRPMTTKHREIP